MIARIALLAIWRPKLSETFFAPNAVAPTASSSPASSRCVVRRRERLGADLEALVVAVR